MIAYCRYCKKPQSRKSSLKKVSCFKCKAKNMAIRSKSYRIRKGIVITTSEHTKDFLNDCLLSLPRYYKILVVSNNGYVPDIPTEVKRYTKVVINDWNGFELGGILRGAEYFDEFVHLMDTCVVTNKAMFKLMFDNPQSVYLCNGFFSYLGKYRTEVLNKIGIPKIHDKEMAIRMERDWNRTYLNHDHCEKFSPELPVTTDTFIEKNGRLNMVLDNNFIIKFKARWK